MVTSRNPAPGATILSNAIDHYFDMQYLRLFCCFIGRATKNETVILLRSYASVVLQDDVTSNLLQTKIICDCFLTGKRFKNSFYNPYKSQKEL